MPQRKKTNLSLRSRNAKRMRLSRSQESEEDREARLSAIREHIALSRESETFTERESRLSSQRTRTATLRSQESIEEREVRLSGDRERHSLSRESETFIERESRLSSQRTRTATLRSQESIQEREVRLSADRERHSLSRESETFTERESRLSSQRTRTATLRSQESIEERQARLLSDREHHALSRESESLSQREERLQIARHNYVGVQRNNESYLASERERIDELRRAETAEQRQSRLEMERARYHMNRETNSEADESIEYDDANILLPWDNREKSGFTYSSRTNYAGFTSVGDMKEICNFCHALKWRKETDGMCCSNGKIVLPNFQDPPHLLKSLLNGDHPQSKHFLDNIRLYNSAFQMTSFGAKQITEGPFMPTFKVQGQVYHLIGSLLPENEPKFLQIYFVSDYTQQLNVRNHNFPQLNAQLLAQLQELLHHVNQYVREFKAALESIPQGSNDFKIVISADRRPVGEHRGRHNAPVADEVAVVLVDQECERRDIVLRTRDDRLQRILETHRAYDALQYPLIYCHGEDGYNFGLYQVNPTTRVTNYNQKKISAQQYYSYLLQIRQNSFVYLQRFRGLFSQFIVDMYAKIETERLVYIRTNQRRLRAEEYVHLRDAMQSDNNVEDLGRLVILPSSFTGGPRYMHERTQDAFCYVRKYGRPDLFITFTTNPKWTEICQALLTGQAPYDRHDIIARIFHLKLKVLINLLTKEKVFGSTLCFMYSVEWQKRGLPHAHILLWLEENIRPDAIDSVISSEFPDYNADPILHDIIKTHMVHGPCGVLNRESPCMKDGQCSKKYPRALKELTMAGENGYPQYRRRSPSQGGFTATIRFRGQEIILDNSWVVPYSPVLSKAFQAHINVEICNSVESIKYICKYVNKGSDQAMIALRNNNQFDEVTRYQSGRYISSSEAVWRILSFPIHERYPPVIHLDVHLEGGQRVYFQPENVAERMNNPRQTTLLAFFRLCERDNFAKSLLYNEVPHYYTYNKQQGVFNRRRRGTAVEGESGIFKEHVIGRVYTVHPNNAECYYLRLLLHTVRGPSSFAELRKVDNIEYPTFQAACRARHLLDGDQHWDDALAEACVSDSPHRLRHLFAILLTFCGLSDAGQLWQKYKDAFAEDFLRQQNINSETSDQVRESCHNRSLLAIQDIVRSVGGNPLSQYGLPTPTVGGERINREYTSEINYNPEELAEILQNGYSNLTSEQRQIFDRVCCSVEDSLGEMLFLDAPGGTGKTFLTKVILAQIRSQNKIALAVASSGIAATLLPGGKTAHTTFKIPIDLDRTANPVCNVSRNSDKAKVLRDCALIVWDECTMANRKAVEAVDRTLRDIRQNDRPMGGLTVLFCGDFRQTLPIIPRGTRADEIGACLKSSILWRSVIITNLSFNMRAYLGGDANAQLFSNVLLQIGNGTYPTQEGGKVTLVESLCSPVASQQELISSVYGDPSEISNHDAAWLCQRAILAPRNDQAAAINSQILVHVSGESREYLSINTVLEEGDATHYPVEFLDSLNTPGLPAHKIYLKVGVPIILLRNLSPPKLCNGTRLRVTNLQRNVIEAEILTGCGSGDVVFIPRIPIIPNNFPFTFKRVQFPVSLCYAMTINKAQGQTLSVAGVDLTFDCFSHGQLYVSLSRVSNPNNLFVYAPGNSTANIVYREALT